MFCMVSLFTPARIANLIHVTTGYFITSTNMSGAVRKDDDQPNNLPIRRDVSKALYLNHAGSEDF